jgi:hypothetical protein
MLADHAEIQIGIFEAISASKIASVMKMERDPAGTNLLEKIMPELRGKSAVYQDSVYHGGRTVLDHMIEVLQEMDQLLKDIDDGKSAYWNSEMITPYKRILRMVAMYHDAGKHDDPEPDMGRRQPRPGTDRVSFFGHQKYGTQIFEDTVRKRLNVYLPLKTRITEKEFLVGRQLVTCHMDMGQFIISERDSGKEVSTRAIRRYLKRLYFNHEELKGVGVSAEVMLELSFLLNEADARGHGEYEGKDERIEDFYKMADRIRSELKEMRRQEAKAKVKPFITGHDLIKMGVPEGLDVGNILGKIKMMTASGMILTREEALDTARRLAQKD